ncbi:MAG: KTSC domain-containing protein [Bacteroidetes bacterium]|nr:KTSC domain-containing protein [Bacteroidota bacterium]MBK8362978.1 KTSC domain-containing protein [Bacteroidota bacterium]MBK9413671.1 KTSC domain-containing protein [Bacteroidota bacterium]MBP6427548.1 KTSC domain-containing protein [Bacteroidia bacterium]MBP6658919.1 KTSC domain-containing protein [Bacteroidia bacterium]
MKRIIESRKLLNADKTTDLANLKLIYRNLIKEWHPDKFQDGDAKKEEAALTSKNIIEAYHLLVSVNPETHALNSESYANTINNSGIDDFTYKGQTLKVTFHDGSVYEYFGVPNNVYTKFLNSPGQSRFARRHIFNEYLHRNVIKASVAVEELV